MKYFIILPLIAITSCATYFDTNLQEVRISTESGVSANCEVVYDNEVVESVMLPAKATLTRSYYPIHIDCLGLNGLKGSAQVYSSVSDWGYGGAVLGLGVGAGVDAYTGAAFEFPQEVVIKLGTHRVIGKTEMNSNTTEEGRW